MRRSGKIVVFSICVASMSACSLFVSLDGLSGPDASAIDASNDASLDSPVTLDAPADAVSQSDASDGGGIFLDDFNRPDAALLGNGWIEKTASAFLLADDEVQRATIGSSDYPDNMVYRPSNEDIEDSQISIELVYSVSISGYPQIHSRIQRDTIVLPGTVDSYLFYVPGGTSATISRTRGAENLSDLATSNTSEPLLVGDRYRLTLRVSGENPVLLSGMVEHFSSGSWTVIASVAGTDSDPSQLDDAGSTGFSGSNNDGNPYFYDNFMRTPL
jgi:hypothetical protein